MNIEPVAYFHSPFTSKFGIPRQSGLVSALPGYIRFTPPYCHAEAVRGLEEFDFLWLIWEFSGNHSSAGSALTVRPPRLGGNERVGVFASRSPYRPNGLGLSCVRIERVELTANGGPVIHVLGADLMDGTPIYDVKPYVAYADAHPDARSGFVDKTAWQRLEVVIPDSLSCKFSAIELQTLREALSLDPRPHYHDDPSRVYGMPFAGHDIHFQVSSGCLTVLPE